MNSHSELTATGAPDGFTSAQVRWRLELLQEPGYNEFGGCAARRHCPLQATQHAVSTTAAAKPTAHAHTPALLARQRLGLCVGSSTLHAPRVDSTAHGERPCGTQPTGGCTASTAGYDSDWLCGGCWAIPVGFMHSRAHTRVVWPMATGDNACAQKKQPASHVCTDLTIHNVL